jgi:ABC-2 type transport system permease protein
MAGVATQFGIGRQIGLIAGLRWRLFVNSLHTGSAKAELVAKIVLGLLGAVFALGGGVGLGAAAYFLTLQRPEMLSLLFWIVFGAWQLIPVFAGAFSVEFDFSNLLRFPLRFPAFFLLSVAYGLFDFAAVLSLVWLTGIGIGIALARPALISWTVLILVAFAAVNLLLGRVIFSWLARLLGQRRTREKFFILFILLSFLPQFIGMAAERWGKQAAPYLRLLKPMTYVLPPGVAGLGLEAAARATPRHPSTQGAGTGAFVLAAYAAGFGLLLKRRLLNQYRGEELGESEAPQQRVPGETRRLALGIDLPGLPGRVAAMVEKEYRYMMRSGPMLMVLLIPIIMVPLFLMGMTPSKGAPGFFKRSPELVYPSMLGYAGLVMLPFSLNSFAFDGRGILLLLAAPVRFREVLMGKNLAMGSLMFAQGLAIWLIVAILKAPPHAATVLATLAMLLFAVLLSFTVGNILSLYSPRAFDYGKFRQRQSGLAVLFTFGILLVVGGIAVGVFAAAHWLGSMWYAVAGFWGLVLATFPVYSAVLDFCSGLAQRRREKLAAELCK